MADIQFKLATFAATGGGKFAAIVHGRRRDRHRRARIAPIRDSAAGRAGALGRHQFGLRPARGLGRELRGAAGDGRLHRRRKACKSARFAGAVAPARRFEAAARRCSGPGKILNAAQNFQEHVNEMIRAGMSPSGPPVHRREDHVRILIIFLKASSCLAGAYDDIAIPHGMSKIDWEAEICHRHRPQGQARAGRARDSSTSPAS